jgi:dienelactone hydrolase
LFESPLQAERLMLAGIPAMHVRANTLSGPAPTVLLYCGWSGTKESEIFTAEILALDGLRVIIPELPRHGERGPALDHFSPEGWARFWEILFQAVDEAGPVLEAAVAAGLADPARTGLAGISAGGMVALGAMARLPRVRATAALISCPAFEYLEEVSASGRGEGPMPEDLRSRIRAYDPVLHLAQIAPRPLLLMNGTADTTLPFECVRRFAADAEAHYQSRPEALQMTEIPGLAHHTTLHMVKTLRPWLLAHL